MHAAGHFAGGIEARHDRGLRIRVDLNATHLVATYSRMIGLESGRIGEGAAISLYLFPLLVFVVWAQLRFVRKQAY